jgi:hypothetical protein
MPVNVATNAPAAAAPGSKKGLWTGRVLSGLAILFLVFDGVTKVLKVPQVMQASAELQFPDRTIPVIGAVLLFCTLVYAIPQTSVLGAVLLTGYLGGAVANATARGQSAIRRDFISNLFRRGRLGGTLAAR